MYDTGFAPNPFWDYCTVACCKARYRKNLGLGDWLVGTSSKVRHGTGTRLVYAMKITELLSYKDYSENARFKSKIPSYGLIEQRGDNIYRLDKSATFSQRVPSYHSKGMKHTGHGKSDRWILTGPWEEHDGHKAEDLNGKVVPISSTGNFWYFGGSMELPEEFLWLVVGGQGMKHHDLSDKRVRGFLDWLWKTSPGIHGDPLDFNKTPLFPPDIWQES